MGNFLSGVWWLYILVRWRMGRKYGTNCEIDIKRGLAVQLSALARAVDRRSALDDNNRAGAIYFF